MYQHSTNTPLDIVCIGMPKWEDAYASSTKQLISRLARHHRLLYVEYPFTLTDALKGLLGRPLPTSRILGKSPRLREETAYGGRLHVLTLPPIMPINWIDNPALYRKALKVNSSMVRRGIKKAMGRLGMEQPVVVNAFNPFYGLYNRGAFQERKVAYYCYDDMGSAKWLGKHGVQVERAFMQKTDMVLVTSEALLEDKKRANPNCHLIKNGVDAQRFATAVPKAKTMAKPLIGYVGSLNDRLDYPLLAEIIAQTPQYHYRFIGPIQAKSSVDKLNQFQNVEFTGAIPYEALPEQVAAFDVGLIPFVKNAFTARIYPLKINEYLAAGVPVAMTPFARLPEFEPMVEIAEGAADFQSAIRKSLAASSEQERADRKAFAMQNAWERRAAQMSALLQQ